MARLKMCYGDRNQGFFKIAFYLKSWGPVLGVESLNLHLNMRSSLDFERQFDFSTEKLTFEGKSQLFYN